MHGNAIVSLTAKVRRETSNPWVHAVCFVAEMLQERIASYQARTGCSHCLNKYRGNKRRAREAKQRAKARNSQVD
jgi:hypothetical protein